MKEQIINIINFIRDIEPRCEVDLVTAVKEQINLMKKHNLRGTFLLQYDALMDPVYQDLLKALPAEQFEIGVWLEMVQGLIEKAGIKWRGEYAWDWHSNNGFSVGYTFSERERIIDVLFSDFKSVFGYYPRSLGSWAFDAYIINYAAEKYGLDACCNCKEQYGTDGYTLWGGYYGQAYYPAKNNVHSPAQTADEQINVPLFKMLGSDPIYQYDLGLSLDNGAKRVQEVVTLEPVYTGENGGGGIPAWVDWYLRENFSGNCLAFGYAQAGQENSFGWDKMGGGLIYQFEQMAKLRDEGKLIVEPMCESGRRFKKEYSLTPPTTIVALTDWSEGNHKSVWYSCANYRTNVYAEENKFWIRDAYIFDQNYRERYFTELCVDAKLTFDNLPVIDGNVFSGNGIRAGLYPYTLDGEALTYTEFEYFETNAETAVIALRGTQLGNFTITLSPLGMELSAADGEFMLKNKFDTASPHPDMVLENKNKLKLTHRNFDYFVNTVSGEFVSAEKIKSSEGKIIFA